MKIAPSIRPLARLEIGLYIARMVDAIRIQGAIVATSRADDGLYEAVIAVNDDVGDGKPLHLRDLELDDYLRKNPVVLYNHDRWTRLPIGQTASINWEPRGMVAKFRFMPGDEFAAQVQNAWDHGFLRAASIHATPIVEPGQPFGSATRYRLTEWSIVPVPADVDAVRSLGNVLLPTALTTHPPTPSTPSTVEPSDMDAQQVADIVKRQLDERDQESRRGAELKNTIVEVLREHGIIQADPQGGDDGSQRAASVAPAAGDAPTAPAAGDGGDGSESEQDKIDKAVTARSEVLEMTRELLPEGFDVSGKSNKDILVAACGEEVEDAASRSEDYLKAKLEGITERRSLAGGNVSLVRTASAGTPVAGYQLTRPLDPMGMRRAAQKGRAA